MRSTAVSISSNFDIVETVRLVHGEAYHLKAEWFLLSDTVSDKHVKTHQLPLPVGFVNCQSDNAASSRRAVCNNDRSFGSLCLLSLIDSLPSRYAAVIVNGSYTDF